MLKKYLSLLIIIVGISTFSHAQSQGADMIFETKVHDFGKVKAGNDCKFDFKYTNEGNDPLVVISVKVSCNCTKVKWQKKPLKKGEKAFIAISFNSKDKGAFMKEVTIISNAKKDKTYLIIKGIVE